MYEGGRERPVRNLAADDAALPGLPYGTVLALVGGLALVAAFWMPWIGIQVGNQGALLSGNVLGRLLSGTSDLRQFVPGSSGNPLEAQALRALVYLFPTCGALAALLALLEGWLGRRRVLAVLLAVVGLVPLVGVVGGLSFLPQSSSREVGLWVIGAGSVAVVLGPIVNTLLARRQRAVD
jgi:hypothetical protein